MKLSDTIYIKQGDCLELMKKIQINHVDLLLTDPPYGIDLTPQRGSGKFKNTKVVNDNNLNWLDAFVEESYRVCKNAGLIFCNWQNYDKFKQAFEKKFIIKNLIVWDKDWFGLGNNFRPNHEFIMLVCKTNVKTKSNNLSNILKFRRMVSQKMQHSCEKPVALLELLITELSEENEIVLDPFAGSFSTGEASANLKRKFIGYELDEKYFEIGKNRLLKAIKDQEDNKK